MLIEYHAPIASARMSIARANEDQTVEITSLINAAFWPSHKVFLDENNPKSYLRVTQEFIKEAISAADKEFYILVDEVDKIIGTILLQKNIEGDPDAAKFTLLAKNPVYNHVKVGDLLISHVINRVEALKKTILKIEVVDAGESENKLIKYYEDLGFCKTGKTFDFPRKPCLKSNFANKVKLIELFIKINGEKDENI